MSKTYFCPKCNCENIKDVSDLICEMYICNECDHYWIVGIVKHMKVNKVVEKREVREKAWEYFLVIKSCLEGINEVLNLTYSNEDSIMFLCGIDNLIALRDGIVDIMNLDYDPKYIRSRLMELEFEIKKNLFFNECKKTIKL